VHHLLLIVWVPLATAIMSVTFVVALGVVKAPLPVVSEPLRPTVEDARE
jgi:hypothetical protein